MGNVIDLEEYKRNLVGNGRVVSADDFSSYIEINDDRLGWFSACDRFRGMELFLRRLFYDNHDLKKGRNPDSAFLIGFSEEHTASMEAEIAQIVKGMGRRFYSIDAAGKTFRQLVEQATDEEHRTDCSAFQDLTDRLLGIDAVVTFKGFSASKIPSRYRAGYIRDLIKTWDDAHHHGVLPQSDLIFLDSGSFLDKIWGAIGENVKVATFR